MNLQDQPRFNALQLGETKIHAAIAAHIEQLQTGNCAVGIEHPRRMASMPSQRCGKRRCCKPDVPVSRHDNNQRFHTHPPRLALASPLKWSGLHGLTFFFNDIWQVCRWA